MPLDPFVARLFKIESGGNPYAVTGSNRGLGQFGPAEERQYGISDANRSDPNAQAAAVQRETERFRPILAQKLGRDPTPGELYLMHQQGIAGGPALLSADPNTPAWQAIRPYYGSDAIAQKAIGGNIPTGSPLSSADPAQITAGDFSKYWVSKFEGGNPDYASFNTAALTPGSQAPPLPAPTTIGGAAQQSPLQMPTLAGLLGGGTQPQQQQQQAGLLGGSPLNMASGSGLLAQQDIPVPNMQMPQAVRPQVNMAPLLSFLQANAGALPRGWA